MDDRTPDPLSLDDIERASIDELRALQLQRMRASLRHAYENVPHDRAAFDGAGVLPEDCTDLADISRLPFAAKADLRADYPFGMLAVPRAQVSRIHTSSGGRTGDLTRLMPGTARPMRRIEKITGRSDDMIVLRGVILFPTQIEEPILRTPALSPHFQCRLDRPGRSDELAVMVERRVAADAATAGDQGDRLVALIKNQIGVTVAVDVVAQGGIERSVGEMRRIIDNRPKA